MVREYLPIPSVPNKRAINNTDPNCRKAESTCLLSVNKTLTLNFLLLEWLEVEIMDR